MLLLEWLIFSHDSIKTILNFTMRWENLRKKDNDKKKLHEKHPELVL